MTCGTRCGTKRGTRRSLEVSWLVAAFFAGIGLVGPGFVAPGFAELGAVPALGQGATLECRVLDPEDRPVAGAVVIVSSQAEAAEGSETPETRTTETDENGRFELADLTPGPWSVQVNAPGFEELRRTVTLSPDEIGSLDLRLLLGEVRQEIYVSSDLPDFGSEVALSTDRLTESASRDLALSLRDRAGIAANRRGPINLEPTVRGLQETQVAMFVDGTRTFAAGPGRMDSDISHVSPHAVESVRVVKGPYALTWGAGTLSALEIETFAPDFTGGDFEVDGLVHFNYGDNADTSDVYAGAWGGDDRFTFSVLHNQRQGADYEDGGGRTVPGDYRSDDTRWSLGWRIGEAGIFHYQGGYQGQDDLDYPGRILDATYFKTRSHTLDYRWQPGSSGGVTGGITDGITEVYGQIYTNRKDHRMNNDEKPTAQPNPGRIPPFAIDVDLETESNTSGGKLYVELGRDAWSWKLGGDFFRSEQNADRTVSRRTAGRILFQDVVWPDAEIDDLGLYGQGIYRGGDHQIGATVRVDRIESTAGRPSDFFLANTSGSLDQTDTEISAAVSGRFRLGDALILTAGLGRAVRGPNAQERYSDRFPATKFQLPAEFLGAPDLEPESSLEVDFGLEASAGTLVVDLDFFWREIDDYITVIPDPTVPRRLPLSPPVVFRYINGTRATFYGGELELRQPLGTWLSWRGAVAWSRAEDELFDEPVLGIAPLTARLAWRLDPPRARWWGEVEATLADRQDRVAEIRFEVPTPGYTVFDMRGGVRIAERWEIRAGLENATDKDYALHLNAKNPFTGERIREPGRNFILGLGLNF